MSLKVRFVWTCLLLPTFENVAEFTSHSDTNNMQLVIILTFLFCLHGTFQYWIITVVTLCMLGQVTSADFFFKINIFKLSFRNTIRVSIGLDPDQERAILCQLSAKVNSRRHKTPQAWEDLNMQAQLEAFFVSSALIFVP